MNRILSHLKENWIRYGFETFVVTISILGAFALNNWNESRKQQVFEREVLTQILVNLRADEETLLQIRQNFKEAISSSDKIIEYQPEDETADSLKFWLADIIQFDRFQPLTNSYELLKSNGLNNLSNKEMAFLLGKYYDDIANHTVRSIQDIETSFNNDWVPVLKMEVEEVKFKQYVVLTDWDILTSPNGHARKLLILNRDNYGGGLNRINIALKTIEELIGSVEHEVLD